ncbi:MAG: trypsin-like peptidase domain-containing protein [Minisyncoccales bacterium]|jgi:serine protease Do
MEKRLSAIKYFIIFLFGVLISLLGVLVVDFFESKKESREVLAPILEQLEQEYQATVDHERAIIDAVDLVSPAVVSITVSRDISIPERRNFFDDFFDFFESEKKIENREVGGGTGFIISSDGIILTNRHLVSETDAQFAVLTNDGQSFTADVLARDPVQDLAILKIDGKDLPTVKIGDSSGIRIGQTVIAIGNSLGEFRNTVSVGVVSGLGRSISATDGRTVEVLEDVIQTDAAINRGNSGGPLLNLKGEVIGINTAVAIDAQSIGFSIPINKAKRMIESVLDDKELVYPFLGVRYMMIDPLLVKDKELTVDYGALIISSDNEPAIDKGSAADKAGLVEGDIILEVDGKAINSDNYLAGAIQEFNPGDTIELKVIRNKKEMAIKVTLGEKR